MEARDRQTAVLAWHVPGLVDRPAVGTSCCATTAEALIAAELFLVPGVIDLRVDVAAGRLEVVTDPSRVGPEVVADALDAIGYPPARHGDPNRA